jgi:endonuclease/exonuclease/phosphatase (EEP) superfamily protein YafD
MVAYTGKTLRTDTTKPVNLPEALTVEENTAGLPTAVKLKRRQNIIDVEDCWRIDDEWWRSEPVSRLYYVVILSSGQRVVLAKNLVDNCWYRQSY